MEQFWMDPSKFGGIHSNCS